MIPVSVVPYEVKRMSDIEKNREKKRNSICVRKKKDEICETKEKKYITFSSLQGISDLQKRVVQKDPLPPLERERERERERWGREKKKEEKGHCENQHKINKEKKNNWKKKKVTE